MQLTVVVPELIWPEPEDRATLDALDCPALTTLLARSQLRRRPPQSLEATLGDAFDQPDGVGYAALRLLGEDEHSTTGEACWLCADPVHLRLHQEQLILADGRSLAVTVDEAREVIEELNRQFSDSGHFHYGAADRWYLRLPATTRLGTFEVLPLSAVSGRRVGRQLPETTELRWLRRLLNELQMVLHDHPVNQRREEQAQPTINSLWLWGGGSSPVAASLGFTGIWGDAPLLRGLARHFSIPWQPLPSHADDLLNRSTRADRQLLLLDTLQAQVHYEDGPAYRQALLDLENRWFAPLRQALVSGRLRSLRLEAPTAYATLSWHSRPVDQWRFWRQSVALATTARTLAQDGT